MASAQENSSSSDPTDINHVLESLGSLIGELDACVTDVQDEQVISNAWVELWGALFRVIIQTSSLKVIRILFNFLENVENSCNLLKL